MVVIPHLEGQAGQMRQDDEYHPNYMAADLLPHEFDGSYGMLPFAFSEAPMSAHALDECKLSYPANIEILIGTVL